VARDWWIVLLPLAFPTALASIGFALTHYAIGRCELKTISRSALLAIIAVALLGALIPNVGQLLYDIGLGPPVTDVVETGSYVVFGAAMAAAWNALRSSPKRWLLLPLVPLSFAQGGLWTFAYIAWTLRGFAP
jgi:hypothetical protein